MDVKIVGVVGAGVMGRELAQVFAQAGHKVIATDISEEILINAQKEIREKIRLHRLFKKMAISESVDGILQRIEFSTDLESLSEADFVIESATEAWEIKRNIFKLLDRICPRRSVLGTNTSAIPITRIASVTSRPAKILGMHFMNPASLKRMVEVVRGYHTSEETIEICKELLASLAKECIVVNDSPGFVSNRVLMLMVNEAICLLHDQVASVEEIDRIFKTCVGHKMGPLETADLIGLDTVLYSIEVLYESFKDNKYRPCPLLKKMVDAGHFGRKSGRGFYNYSIEEIDHR